MYQLNFFYKNDPRKNIYMFVSDSANTLAEAKKHFATCRKVVSLTDRCYSDEYIVASNRSISSIKTEFINVITDLHHRYTKKQYAN